MRKDNVDTRTPEEEKAAYQQAHLNLKKAFGFENIQDTVRVNQVSKTLQLGNKVEIHGEFKKREDESFRIMVSQGFGKSLDFTLDEKGLRLLNLQSAPISLNLGSKGLQTFIMGAAIIDRITMLKEDETTFGSMGIELAEWITSSLDRGELLPLPISIGFPLIPQEGVGPTQVDEVGVPETLTKEQLLAMGDEELIQTAKVAGYWDARMGDTPKHPFTSWLDEHPEFADPEVKNRLAILMNTKWINDRVSE